jgi:thioesterase domain-containing protein
MSSSLCADRIIFTRNEELLGRGSVRGKLQAAIAAAGATSSDSHLVAHPEWQEVKYALVEAVGCADESLTQLLQLVNVQQSIPDRNDTHAADAVHEQRVHIKPLAAGFADALADHTGADPLDVLMAAYDGVVQGMKQPSASSSYVNAREGAPLALDDAFPCLLLLRYAKTTADGQPPLIIVHSLLGDHKGYGRFWSLALPKSAVYAMRHRHLNGAGTFTLDREGAVRMAAEYASAVEAMASSTSVDLIGASFGAVLASHVACASRAVGGCPRRVVLIDPPPVVPKQLPMPQMLASVRTAAMGVLLLHLHIEMGATVWEQFPQLQTLPLNALPCFVAAQCLPTGASKDELAGCVERFRRLLAVYRQCRHAFHTLSSGLVAFRQHSDGSPALLMALSAERWSTFREMFPGLEKDDVQGYGSASTLRLPGMHIAMINRCLGNSDAEFTGAVERCAACALISSGWNVMFDRGPLPLFASQVFM